MSAVYEPPRPEQQFAVDMSCLGRYESAVERLHAPAQVYVAGDYSLMLPRWRVAIVGSRLASQAGLQRARAMAMELARAGVVVVSGLARGIDRAAHEGALDAGGRTMAVLGTPLDECYPPEHATLQRRLCDQQLVISQFSPGHRTERRDFVTRNWLMALLCHAVVVVKAGDRSGTLTMLAEAQRLGRLIFLCSEVWETEFQNLRSPRRLKWPQRFLEPVFGRPALVVADTASVITALLEWREAQEK